MKHQCDILLQYKKDLWKKSIPVEMTENGANIEYIQKSNDSWWLSVNGEYAMPVLYCPFCGVKLDE